MSDVTEDVKTVVVEREFPHPPEKLWRALTEPELISDWLMKNDFVARTGQAFTLTGDWGSVACKVRELDPGSRLSYSWEAMGLQSVVTWTLTPVEGGTHLRMEQTGFRRDQGQAYAGAKHGWDNFLGKLATVLEGIH